MDQLISHIAACCSAQQPAQSDGEDVLDALATCMQQLRVGDSRSEAQDSSCRSLHVRSPKLRASEASPAIAAADSTTTAELPQYRVFTFDIETTGLSTTKDAIIEMALVDVISNSSWSSLVKPEPYKKSSREAYKAHGISHYELSKPHVPTLLQALTALHSFIHRHTAQQPGTIPLLVAHNGYTFDFRALAVAIHRQQQQQQGGQPSGQPISSSSNGACGGGGGDGLQMMLQLMPEHLMVWDTLALARRLKLHKRCNLTNLQQATIREHFLGSSPSVVHRALADAQELAALLPHLLHWAAAQVDQGLDEKLLPRTFDGFVSAAAAAAAAAAGVVDRAAAVEVVDNAAAATSSSCTSSNLAVSELRTVSTVAAAPVVAAAAAGTQGGRSAAGRARSSSRGRGRRKRLPPAAAAAVDGAASSKSGGGVQQQQRQQQLVLGSKNVTSRPSISAAVAAVAAITIDSSSEAESENMSEKNSEGASEEQSEGESGKKSERENSPAAAAVVVAAAAVGAVTHSPLCTDNRVCVVADHGSSSSTAVSAVGCVAGIAQQQHTSASGSSSSSSMFQSRVAADQAACSAVATTYDSSSNSSSSGMEQTASARLPSRSSPAAAAADGIGFARPLDPDAIAIQDTHTSSSSSSGGGGGNSGCSSSARPGQAAAANGLGSSHLGPTNYQSAITPNSVMVKGRSVKIMSSSAFLDLVRATISSSSSSSVTPDPDHHFRSDLIPRSDLIYLGQYIAGRSDSSSGFSEVLVSHLGLPVVFLLEDLVISKNIKFSHTGGRIKAASLPVKCATRQRAQQQHIKQVAAAINSLTQLQQQQQQQATQQQQQHQELYTCMVGTSLQLRLPIKTGAPFLDTTIRQLSISSSTTSSSSSTKRLIPLATPNLASEGATDRLQQILPVGAHVSVVLWPSCVWSNSKFRGVTLNCVELWLQEH